MIFIRIFISLLVSAACIHFALRNVHWDELKTIISGARMGPILMGLLVSLITLWLRSFRWQILLNPFQKISIHILVRWQIGGLFINNLMTRTGEIARAYWAGHKSAIPKSTLFATVIIERALDVMTIMLIGVPVIFLLQSYHTNPILLSDHFLAFIFIGLALALLAVFFLKRFDRKLLFEKIKNILPEKLYMHFEKFVSGLRILKDKSEVVKISLLSVVIWSVDITALAILSRALQLNLSWIQAGFTMVGLIIGAMIPSPAAVTIYEGGGLNALTLIGFDKSLAFSFILLLHGSQLLMVTLLGIPSLIIEGFNPKKLFENEQDEKNEKNTP